MLRIRIWIQKQCCGYGSGRIGIILPDPGPHLKPADPDLYLFQPNVKKN